MADIDDVVKVDEGLYVVRENDTPRSVASLLYSNPLHARTLMDANPKSTFNKGEQIVVPNRKGRTTYWTDTSIDNMLKRMFPNQPVHIFKQLFKKWNNDGDIEQGAKVFVPER